jgi:hypothetical protein
MQIEDGARGYFLNDLLGVSLLLENLGYIIFDVVSRYLNTRLACGAVHLTPVWGS